MPEESISGRLSVLIHHEYSVDSIDPIGGIEKYQRYSC